jgi:hypothetical protein
VRSSLTWIGERGGHAGQGFGIRNLLRRAAHGEAAKKRSRGGVPMNAAVPSGWRSPSESYDTGVDRGG